MEQVNAPAEPQEMDITQLARAVDRWYVLTMNQLMTAAHLPPETKLEGKLDPDGETVVLTGDARKAFIAGVIYAIDVIGVLPFVAKEQEVTPDEQTD